jgi:transposase
MKYLSGIPINRFNELINDNEYKFNPSTVIGGFEKLLEYMKPLYSEILKYNQQESHWHADETRWCKMVDVENGGKRMYWMWVFVGGKSVVYVLDPTRSSKVPEKYFKNTEKGILNVDRLASYNIVGDKIILAYCWYHLRRDIIDIGKKYSNLAKWSIDWLLKIRNIENLNRNRFIAYSQNLSFDKNQIELEKLVNKFFEDAKKDLESGSLNNYQTKVLKNMIKKRKGYCTFVDYPWVPLHNNVAERQFRHIAYARNNYGGSNSQWGGEFAAVTWTIFKTAQINNLNPIEYLKEYFEKYILSTGFKEGIPEELLPWNYKIDIQLDNINSA